MQDRSASTDHTCLADFQALWQRNLVDGAIDTSDRIHRHLVDAYSESHRYYHTLEHIQRCLSLLKDVDHLLEDADALALAIWFHDAIYLPGAIDNERLSAQWFMALSRNIFADNLRNRVHGLIMATLHNGTGINDPDTRFMVDIDLSSFGLPWAEFSHDSENVRKELVEKPDGIFFRKQFEFVKSLQQKPRFFQSDYFFRHYEHQARENLVDYLEAIKSHFQTE